MVVWKAWPNDWHSTEEFDSRAEAEAYVLRCGGGAIRKLRYRSGSASEVLGETIELEAA